MKIVDNFYEVILCKFFEYFCLVLTACVDMTDLIMFYLMSFYIDVISSCFYYMEVVL